MIKKISKIVAFAAMVVFVATAAFADPESNTSKATFGEFDTDVGSFLDSTGWKDLELGKFFAFSRFGANIPQAKLDAGFGVKVGGSKEARAVTRDVAGEDGEYTQVTEYTEGSDGLYFGVYYRGGLTAQSVDPSERVPSTIYRNKGAENEAKEQFKISQRNKANPDAFYGVVLGLSNGVGLKLTLEDQLGITSTGAPDYLETRIGTMRPYVELGKSFGPINKIGLGVLVDYNRHQGTYVDTIGSPNTVTRIIFTEGINTPITSVTAVTAAEIMGLDGNYIEPDIFLDMGFGMLSVSNNLKFRIYGMPGGKFGSADGSDRLAGVGIDRTHFSMANDPAVNVKESLWDNRFYIRDEIEASVGFEGSNESGVFSFSVTPKVPVGLTFTNHKLNYKLETSDTAVDNINEEGFLKSSVFAVDVAPAVTAGVKVQPVEMLSLHAGVELNLFNWTMITTSVKDGKKPAEANETLINNLGGPSVKAPAHVENRFTYPSLSLAGGFSFNFKGAELDMVLIKDVQPTTAGMIYKAVGDGFGNGDTSIVLSIKF